MGYIFNANVNWVSSNSCTLCLSAGEIGLAFVAGQARNEG